MVEFNYTTQSGFYLDNGKDEGLTQNGFYSFQSFELGNGSMTYRAVERENSGDSPASDIVVIHYIAGNGVVHFVDLDEEAEETTHHAIDGSVLDESALNTALAGIEKLGNLPLTAWTAREELVPDFASAEYVALKVAHENNRANNDDD